MLSVDSYLYDGRKGTINNPIFLTGKHTYQFVAYSQHTYPKKTQYATICVNIAT